jgi:hypothetical protein
MGVATASRRVVSFLHRRGDGVAARVCNPVAAVHGRLRIGAAAASRSV